MYLSFTSSRVLKHPSYRFLYYLESVTFSFTIFFLSLASPITDVAVSIDVPRRAEEKWRESEEIENESCWT